MERDVGSHKHSLSRIQKKGTVRRISFFVFFSLNIVSAVCVIFITEAHVGLRDMYNVVFALFVTDTYSDT
jgi:hypothetical protein